ncbi:xanthine dehydrogenase family protein molybdopterin-binding subunit [Daejeonella lutea]|nr:molybdopterin cofactor-binding domain-containing protein [Daejeonella lutea]
MSIHSDPGQNYLNRRKFFKLLGGGLAVVFVSNDLLSLASNRTFIPIPENQIGAWVHVGEDGIITVFTGKTEVGQNIRTSLAQVVAEELQVSLDSVRLVMADTDLVPNDFGTVGSRSTPQMGAQLRKASAAARHELIRVAAAVWKTDPDTLVADGGFVSDPTNKNKMSYGQLSGGKRLLVPISDATKVIPIAERKISGTSVPKVNIKSFLTGKHKYVSDMKVTGMVYGKILRPPAYKSELIDADTSAAKAIPGVIIVQEGGFIGVTANDPWTAAKAIKVIHANWKTSPQKARSELFEHLKNTGDPGRSSGIQGDLSKGLREADHKHKASYQVDYIAHVPLEPRAAIAFWEQGKLTVYTGTQRPFGVRDTLAGLFNIPKEMVRVIVPDTGSAYGGKHSGEAAEEAAKLSKAVGKPVKLVWTREEEFTWAYFRPAGVIEINSGVRKDGTITAWDFHNYNSGPAAIATPYTVANQQNLFHPADTPLKQGSYRGLASTANVFARESHMGDLARMLEMDQLDFRLKNLKEPRFKAVLEAAAKSFGWGARKKSPGNGFGIATGFDKGGYVATCAEVSIINNRVKVIRITEAFECGAIVNPAHLHNQIMGSIVQGLGGALFEAVDFAGGKILNPSISSYRVPRFSDLPEIEIVMIDRKDLPSAGAGEAPIIGVAPAIRNAILDATGIGLTALPLIPDGKVADNVSG